MSKSNLVRIFVSLQQPPFVFKDKDGKFNGYCIDLLKELKKIIEFEYEIYEAPDGIYGRMSSTGEWNGMVKELMDKVRSRNYKLNHLSWLYSFFEIRLDLRRS